MTGRPDRNFSGRNDGNHATLSFLTSPEVVTAMALAGRLDFDPLRDSLPAGNGKQVRLAPPTGSDLPADGFATSLDGYSWSGFQIPVLDPSSDLVAPPLFDSDDLKQPAVIQPNNYPGTDLNGIPYPRFLLYYAGDPEEPLGTPRINRIGLASGS